MKPLFSLIAIAATACTTDGGPPPDVDNGQAVTTPGPVCATITEEATFTPVNVIITIDSNGNFLRRYEDQIQSAVDDLVPFIDRANGKLVVIGYAPPTPDIAAPLGNDGSRYLQVNQTIGAHRLLFYIGHTWDRYKDFIYPDATSHLLSFTNGGNTYSADNFMDDMGDNLGDFTYNAIASPEPTCPNATGPGQEHYALASKTGGSATSVCLNDWSPTVQAVQRALAPIDPLPCTVDVPSAPARKVLEESTGAFSFTQSNGQTLTAPNVSQSSGCSTSDGWYYDRSTTPTTIKLCPNTCNHVQQHAAGRYTFTFRCTERVE